MEILRDLKQIEEKLRQIFGIEVDINIEKFIRENLSDIELNFLANNVKQVSKDENLVNAFSDLIFQLKNYIPALNNFVKLLLLTEDYEGIFYFVKKIFVAQIGQIKYTSVKQPYTYLERYFDRFIEIVKNCEIEKTLYLPLILKAFESDKSEPLFSWKRPAVEYMQNFFNENEEWTLEYIDSNLPNKYKLLEIIADFNTSRGVKMLIDDFINEDNFDEEQNSHILKKYKRETFLELDKRLLEEIDDNQKARLTAVFFAFGKDNEALTRLNDLYSKANTDDLKSTIADRLEIIERPEIKSEKQFLYTARRKVKEPQERTLGIPFDQLDIKLKSGFPATNEVITYLISTFKEENNLSNLKNLEYLFNVFETESLNNFAERLFDVLEKKDDIKESKWAIRFVSLLGSKELTKQLAEFAGLLFAYDRVKEAKYLVECLANCGKTDVVKVLSCLEESENVSNEWKEECLSTLTKKANVSLEDIKDELAIGKIDDIENQKQRLFDAFLNGREYSEEYFEKLAKEEPFKSLFEKLVWGEYKFGKLYNAFVMTDGEKKYIQALNKEGPFSISIVHTIDIDDRFNKLAEYLENPLFEQFKKYAFNTKECKPQVVEIGNFAGMFVNTNKFVEKLEKSNFKVNKADEEITFSSLINLNYGLGIACVSEFNKPVTLSQQYSNLGSIYFFKISDLMFDQGKYIYSKSNALAISNLPCRYFDYCMSAILTSAQ